MTLRHLKIFITVCDSGSVTGASKKLFISQPAISTAIKNLEDYYNVKLFDRISKKMYLTEIGKQLLDQSRHLVDLYEHMESGIIDWKTGGTLKVGSSITIGNFLLPSFIKLYKDNYKSVKINVSINSSRNIENMVLKNEIDIALIEGVPHHKKLSACILMDDELVVICSKHHSFASQKQITLKQLMESDLLLREKGSGTRELFNNTLLAQNQTPEPIWESVSTQAIVNAVRLNIGISALPYRLVKEDITNQNIALVSVDGVEFKRKFYMIHHIDKYISIPIQRFIDICKDYSQYNY